MKKMRVHFMGIGGSALAGVAILAKNQGFDVSGCDLARKTYYFASLNRASIKPLVGHSPDHLQGVDILAVSPAVLEVSGGHPEVLEAKKRGILMTWQEFMGRYLQRDKFVIAVAGTHGKSTTTALIGLVLEAAGLDPIVEVGAIVPEWGASVRVGKSKYFVCEADEFNYNFLHYSPSVIVLNNIEMDHPEFFKNFAQLQIAFERFVRRIKGPKILVVNEEDLGIQQLLRKQGDWIKRKGLKVIGYFLKEKFDFSFMAEYQATVVEIMPGLTRFEVLAAGKQEFSLKLPGMHNLANALGVLAAVEALEINSVAVKKAFASFAGLKRRFDLVGEEREVMVFDDYAVHPTAVKATLESAKQKYPQSRIWAVFEPHQFSRLSLFLDRFGMVLKLADKVIVTKIYPGREKDTGEVRAEDLVKKIGAKAIYFPDFEQLAKVTARETKKGDLIIVFGAGNSYLISRMILAELQKNEH